MAALAGGILAAASPALSADAQRPDSAAAHADSASAHGIHIRDAWARATPAGARMGAIYLTIESAAADRLLAAAVPDSVAEETQIHETIVIPDSSGGASRMTMRPVAALELPAGQPVQLKPGGYHIMLMGMKRALKAGDRVAVTLTLENAGKQSATAVVRNP